MHGIERSEPHHQTTTTASTMDILLRWQVMPSFMAAAHASRASCSNVRLSALRYADFVADARSPDHAGQRLVFPATVL